MPGNSLPGEKRNAWLWKYFWLAILLFFLFCSCNTSPYRFPLINTPAVFLESDLGFFSELCESERDVPVEIFYATDRQPAGPEDHEQYYSGKRGHNLRLGRARVRIGDEKMDRQEVRNLSLQKDRKKKLWLQVTGIQEYGALWSTLQWPDPDNNTVNAREPASKFAAAINENLRHSRQKDIFIFVPGYKVVFEYPILVASEFWHYLDYDGVFLAYSWPSIKKIFSYMSDVETAEYSARNFRMLLTFLASETDVRRIHMIGFSAGSRIVGRTIKDLRLIHHGEDEAAVQCKLKIGQLIFAGADIDLEIFKIYYGEGIKDIPEHATVYISKKDRSLRMAEFIFGRTRLGAVEELTTPDLEYLAQSTDISLIDVSEAEGANADRGHDYFRRSPWVSSDVLMTLKFNAGPGQRGLIRLKDEPIWKFPSDYINNLKRVGERVKFEK